MANFDIAHKLTQSAEGGYSNVSTDSGKETYRGVSRVMWPNWAGWVIIDQYKLVAHLNTGDFIPIAWKRGAELDGLVNAFYKTQFWDVNKLDQVNNQPIANELFDSGVNMGTGIAAKFLQEALNLLNRNQKDYSDIAEDGKIGNITLGLANSYPYQGALLKTLNGLQFMRYVSICESDPAQENNFRGWLSRVSFCDN
jgi:lysozyme family protein